MLKRQQELFQFLIQNNPSDINDCCLFLNVSKPTLKSDIDYLNNEIRNHHVSILYFENGLIGFNDLSEAVNFSKIIESFVEMSIASKMQLLLILKNKVIPLQEIADELFVSKSKIVNVANQLLKFSAGLIYSSRNGYYFTDNNQMREEVFIGILAPYFKGNNFIEEYHGFCQKQFDLQPFISIDVIKKAVESVEFSTETSKILKNEFITRLFLSHIFSIFITKIYKSTTNDLFPEPLSTNNVYSEKQKNLEVVMEMLLFIDSFLGTIFSEDNDLSEGLLNHIDFTWKEYRDQIGSIDSLEFLDIKKQYPLSYEASVIASQNLSERYGVRFDTNDLTYLSIHFQNSLEKKKRKKTSINTVILTPYGLTAGKLIDNQLSQKIEILNTVDITSYSEFIFKKYEEEIDLVLSLSYIDDCPVPVIYLPLVLTEEAIREIEHFINVKNYDFLLNSLIDQSLILEKNQIDTPTDAIKFLTNELLKSNAVDDSYLESVLNREEISSTSLKGLAVPHGKISHVIENKLVILKLEKPLNWDGNLVEWIFMLTVNEETMKNNVSFFNNFYRLVSKDMFYITLCKIKNTNEITIKNKLLELFNDNGGKK